MRLTKAEIHPSIFESMSAVTTANLNGAITDPKALAAIGRHGGVWTKEYWKGLTAWILMLVPIIGVLPLTREFGKGVTFATFFFGLLGWLAVGVFLYERNKHLVTPKELEALRPALELDSNQAMYYDCVLSVLGSTLLTETQKRAWLTSLSQALENAMQLQRISEDLLDTGGGKRHSETLEEQRRLTDLVEKSTDPITKDAYLQSLQMVTERISKSNSLTVQAERTEAHLELTRQTFVKTRETLRGMSLQTNNSIQVDLEPLRMNLSKVESESSEIMKAIEELNSI